MNNNRVQIVDLLSPQHSVIDAAVEVLQKGGLIVAPTETMYGLLCRADSQDALDLLYEAKRRPEHMPTAVFVNSIEQMEQYAIVNDRVRRLTEAFLPGPLTILAPAREGLPARVSLDGKVGFRWSSSAVIESIISRVEFPVSATSANLSGKDELTTIRDIVAIFGDSAKLYLDGGSLDNAPSTVVDCTTASPQVLRKGKLSESKIMAAFDRQLI